MDPIYVCGFCKKRLTRAETVVQNLGGRDVLFCPSCKGPCRQERPADPPPAPRLLRPDTGAGSPTPPAPPTPAPPAVPAPSSGLRIKSSDAVEKSALSGPGSEAPVELLLRVQKHVAEVEQRKIDREAKIKRNPWAAFLFPFKPLSLLSIALMLVVFSGAQILMDIGLADDEPRPGRTREEPIGTAGPLLKSEVAGSGEIRVNSGGKTKVLATTEDTGSAGELAYQGQPKAEVPEEDLNANWFQLYRNSGPYHPSLREDPRGEEDPGSPMYNAANFLFPGLIALGLSTFLMRIFFLMYFAAVVLNLIYETSIGTDHFPRWPNPADVMDSFLVPAWHFLFCLLLSFGPALLAFVAPFWLPQYLLVLWLSAPFLLVFGLVYFPMSLMCVAVRGDRESAMPNRVLPALAKAHVHYVPVMIAFLLIPAWPWISEAFLAGHLWAWQRILLDQCMFFTLLVVVTRGLGLVYRRIESKLNWTAFAQI